MFPPLDYIVGSLDTAYTTKEENDPSAMTVWGIFSQDPIAQAANQLAKDGKSYVVERSYKQPHPKAILLYAWAERLELHELVAKITETAKQFKLDTLLIESKASGISVAQEIRRLNNSADFGVQLVNPGAQDKVARAYAVQHLFSEGLVYAPDKSWADMVINQCAAFPKAKHDDLVDTATQALKHLRTTGMLQRADEVNSDLERSMRHHGAEPAALYPI
jgi:predicted phage terminase large subunit-like protein